MKKGVFLALLLMLLAAFPALAEDVYYADASQGGSVTSDKGYLSVSCPLDTGDLVLAGHFHGGMVRIPKFGGVISPQFQIFPKYDAGEFHEGETTMILSRGLGNHSIKLRLFNKPEISYIELKKRD